MKKYIRYVLGTMMLIHCLPYMFRASVEVVRRDANVDSKKPIIMVMLISTMLHDPKFRAVCSRRELIHWKVGLRDYCRKANIAYAYRLHLIGWECRDVPKITNYSMA